MILDLVRRARPALAAILLLTALAGVSHARTNYIYFQNDTDETISTAVGYRNPSGNWVFVGYWTLEPGEWEYVANPITRDVYVWALGMWSGTEWRGGNWYRVPKDGVKRSFRRWNTGSQWGSFTYSFHY